jgi:hypothetical protein
MCDHVSRTTNPVQYSTVGKQLLSLPIHDNPICSRLEAVIFPRPVPPASARKWRNICTEARGFRSSSPEVQCSAAMYYSTGMRDPDADNGWRWSLSYDLQNLQCSVGFVIPRFLRGLGPPTPGMDGLTELGESDGDDEHILVVQVYLACGNGCGWMSERGEEEGDW